MEPIIDKATVVVTPAMAAEWLESALPNRPTRANVVSRFAADMKAGKWVENGHPILFDRKMRMWDGKHRLEACVASGKAFTVITRLLDPATAMMSVDVGEKRRLCDWLAFAGQVHTRCLAAIVVLASKVDNGHVAANKGQAASYRELMTMFKSRQDEFVKAAQFGCRAYAQSRLLSEAQYGYLFMRFDAIDPREASSFFEDLINGVSRTEDPVFLLRRQLERSWQTSKKLNNTTKMALAIKAWNYRLGNEPIRTLMWHQFGPSAEPFPVIEDSRGA